MVCRFILIGDIDIVRGHIFTGHRINGTHIGHTATAIDVVNLERLARIGFIEFGVNIQQQTYGTGHVSLVTTAIYVTDEAALQVPSRTDSHLCHIVTAKEATYLVIWTGGIGKAGVDTHLQNTLVCQLLNSVN